MRFRQHNQQVKVSVWTSGAAGTRAKQDDPHRGKVANNVLHYVRRSPVFVDEDYEGAA